MPRKPKPRTVNWQRLPVDAVKAAEGRCHAMLGVLAKRADDSERCVSALAEYGDAKAAALMKKIDAIERQNNTQNDVNLALSHASEKAEDHLNGLGGFADKLGERVEAIEKSLVELSADPDFVAMVKRLEALEAKAERPIVVIVPVATPWYVRLHRRVVAWFAAIPPVESTYNARHPMEKGK